MSLDVYLEMPDEACPVRQVVFVREDGRTREMSLQEWHERYPGREPLTVAMTDEIFSANITHNLNTMADAAGIYKHLWRPEEIGVAKARELIQPLTAGLARLQADPATFKAHSPPNGWGTYEGLVQFVAEYLAACSANPDADVRVSA